MEGFIAALVFAALALGAFSYWAQSHPSLAHGIGTVVAIGVVVAVGFGIFCVGYMIYDLTGLKYRRLDRKDFRRNLAKFEAEALERQKNLPAPPEPPKLPTVKEWLEKQNKNLRFRGHWITAEPDAGKTNLLNSMILDDIDAVAEGEASIIIMDSKAIRRESLIHSWKRVDFERLDPRLKDRVHLFEPDNDNAINLFDLGDAAHIVGLLQYCFSSLLDLATTELQAGLLTECVIAVTASPQPSIPELMGLLRDGVTPERERYITRLKRDRLLTYEFFLKPIGRTTEFDNKDSRDRRMELLRRFRRLINVVPVLSKTIQSTETRVDLRKLIDEGNIILWNAQTDILGGERCSEFWQRLLTLMLREAANHRQKFTPTLCYIDEADIGIGKDPMLASLIERCRSARIGMIIAHAQNASHSRMLSVTPTLVCPSKMAG